MNPQSPTNIPPKREGEPSSDESTSDYNQLVDQLRSIEGVSEDFASIIANNWQRLLGALAIVLVIVYLHGKYQESQAKQQGDAAALFSEALSSFSIFSNRPGDAPQDQDWAFKQKFALLAEEGGFGYYDELSELFLAHAELQERRFEAARKRLEPVASNAPLDGKKRVDAKRFLGETARLLIAKSYLIEEGGQDKARRILKEIVENGSILNVEALVAFLDTASTDPEKNEAKLVAEHLGKERPELSSLIDRELAERGLVIGQATSFAL